MNSKNKVHILFSFFVLFVLVNIFIKLQWQGYTDGIKWQESKEGLVCIKSPNGSKIVKGDVVYSVDGYSVKTILTLNVLLAKGGFHRYEYIRNGLMDETIVEPLKVFTGLSYYFLAFAGLMALLLALNVFNISYEESNKANPGNLFYLLLISFSGFSIFSATPDYNTLDYIFLILDYLCLLSFPALLLEFSLKYPVKSFLVKKWNIKYLRFFLFLLPTFIFVYTITSINRNYLYSKSGNLYNSSLAIINYFKNVSEKYSILYLILTFIFFTLSNYKLIVRKRHYNFFIPYIGITFFISSFISLSIINFSESLAILKFFFILNLVFLPLCLTLFLSPKKIKDAYIINKKTLVLSSIFLFVFGIYFFLGLNIEKNKFIGIFWSITAILTAGYLFKPIESTLHLFFEKIFFRRYYTFKTRLKDLIDTLLTERDLDSLIESFLDTINKGLNLEKSAIFIKHKALFKKFPSNESKELSKEFVDYITSREKVVFNDLSEIVSAFSCEREVFEKDNFIQFLPLKSRSQLIAVVALSPKKDKSLLSLEDWELLLNISGSLALSIENAYLYFNLEARLAEIHYLKEYNESIIENVNLGIAVLSSDNKIMTWNSFMEQKFFLEKEQVIAKDVENIFGNKIKEILTNKNKFIDRNEEISFPDLNDKAVFSMNISELKDIEQKTSGFIMVFEDITEKINIQKQLITSEKMASIGMLSSGIAHEINTPLTGISSYCQFILDNPDEEDNKEMLEKIQSQVYRANKITRTLLDFARQKGANPKKLNLKELIERSISLIEHKIKQKEIDFVLNLNPDLTIIAFGTRLQQLFINLLINAIDAVSDVKAPQIGILLKEEKDMIVIEFRDNGQGIKSKDMNQIFEPFFTTKEQGEGTGLGLSICYNIVEEHFGKISVKSDEVNGTIFTVKLPSTSALSRLLADKKGSKLF